jgi:hypothetical protein
MSLKKIITNMIVFHYFDQLLGGDVEPSSEERQCNFARRME